MCSSGESQEARGHLPEGVVQSGTGGSDVVGDSLCSSHSKVYFGEEELLVDQLSHPGQVLPPEWSLLPWVFGCSHFDLFATRANTATVVRVSSSESHGVVVWKQDTFQHPWDNLST